MYPTPLTSRGSANPALAIKLTSSEHNTKKSALFEDFCTEEGNGGTKAHLEALQNATMAFLAKHVADRDVWKGYRADLLAHHRDENGNLRTRTAGA